jgi:hypothetical protein
MASFPKCSSCSEFSLSRSPPNSYLASCTACPFLGAAHELCCHVAVKIPPHYPET